MSEIDPKEARGIIAWFARNSVAANILMIFLILTGLSSVLSMTSEVFPAIDPKTITVTVPYPGATPNDVEDSITRRVEEAVLGVEGVERVTSVASEGMGTVTIEMDDFADEEQVFNDVETEVDRLSDFPPENAEQATIVKTVLTSNALTLALYGDVPLPVLHEWAERIEDDIMNLPDVSLVDIKGDKAKEISIEVPEEQLRRYGLTLDNIADAVRLHSQDIPAGTLRTDESEILLRVQERKYVGSSFNDIPIKTLNDGSILRLSDVAEVRDAFADGNLVNTYNGKPALFIQIKRSSAQDTIKIEETVSEYLNTVALPENITLTIWKNETDILLDRMNLLSRNAILGYILVFTCLLLFLDLKLAFWTSMGIPISFLGGLFLVSLTGITINMITLFALIVVLGIVVDDAIVAGESIFAEQERGNSDLSAVLNGIYRVFGPVLVGVLTTIAAFAPLAFSTGTMGQIMLPIPIVVISVLLISLLEAFIILPAHLSDSTRWSRGVIAYARDHVSTGLKWFIENILSPVIKVAITYRYATLAACIAVAIITVGMIQGGVVRFLFFPQIDSDEVSADLTMPVGTPFNVTKKYTESIVEAAEKLRAEIDKELPEGMSIFKSISVTIGGRLGLDQGPGGVDPSSTSSNQSQVFIELLKGEDRPYSSREIERRWQEYTGAIPGAESLTFESNLIKGEKDISIELSHRNEQMLSDAADYLKDQLSQINGLSEIEDSFELGKKEFVFELTEAGLAAGLTSAEVGRQLRNMYYGEEVDRIQRKRNEVKVMVRYPESERQSLYDLHNARIRLNDGTEVDLDTVAKIKEQRGFSTIERVDGRRIVSVSADVDEDITTPDNVLTFMNENILPNLIQRYAGVSHDLAGQSRDQQKDLQTIKDNMLVALMVIFVLLASQLRSYIQPIVIMMAIPFGAVGATIGHWLLGYDLSFISLFGMVALSGVVVNDSVVLIDYYNHLLKDRHKLPLDAMMETVKRRFRPVLLTTLTTSLGLLPMLLETSIQARFLIPMAVSLATGIVFATVIILLMVPSLVLIVEDIRMLFGYKPKQWLEDESKTS